MDYDLKVSKSIPGSSKSRFIKMHINLSNLGLLKNSNQWANSEKSIKT